MSFTLVLFTVIFILGLILTLFINPRYGLYVYLLTLYVHPPSKWWGESFPSIRWSLIGSVVTVLALMVHKNTVSKNNWLSYLPGKMFIAYLIWMSLQFLWVIDIDRQMIGFILLIKYTILYYLIYKLVNNEREIIKFIAALILGSFYLGWLAKGSPGGEGRMEGVGGPGFNDANTLGMMLSVGMIMAAVFMLFNNRKVFVACMLSIPLILNGIILTQSRGAFLALLSGVLVLVKLKPKLTKKKFYFFGILGLVLFSFLANDLFWKRMDTIGLSQSDDYDSSQRDDVASASNRFLIIESQWEMFIDYPLGVGYQGTNLLSSSYMPHYLLTDGSRSSHNTFMAFLVDQGLVGGIIYLTVCLWVIISILNLRKRADDNNLDTSIIISAIGSSFMVIFISGLFCNLLKAEVTIWLLALLTVLLEIDSRRKD